MPKKKKDESVDSGKIDFEFSDDQYAVIDKIKEKCRQKKMDTLKTLSLDRGRRKKEETEKVIFTVPIKVYKKLQKEQEETGLSIQDILRTLLIKRYKVLK